MGRLGRRLLTQLDPALPLNLRDSASGLDYFSAVTALAKVYRTGESTDSFSPSQVSPQVAQYWSDIMVPGPYSVGSCTSPGSPLNSTMSPVVFAYDSFCGNSLNETTALLNLDYYGYFKGGPYTFYNPQYATLYMWRTMGNSNYNAMQVNLKHSMSHGVQFDLSYTFSKSIDLSSDAERVGTIGGTGAQIQNAWSPYQFRAISDFDATHQITANWVVNLPFGRGAAIASNSNGFVNALIGGWQWSGILRWTTGFPFSVGNGYNWATDWDLSVTATRQVT